MQERDIVKIKTEFVREMVSRQIEKGLREKAGYDVDIQIDTLKIVNEDGKTHIHLEGTAEINTKELKKICMNNSWLKNIISAILKLPNGFTNKPIEMIINEVLKKMWGCKADFHIKDKKYTEKHKTSHIYLDTEIKIKTKELEKILKSANLI